MKRFIVALKETNTIIYAVDADSAALAEEKAIDLLNDGEVGDITVISEVEVHSVKGEEDVK